MAGKIKKSRRNSGSKKASITDEPVYNYSNKHIPSSSGNQHDLSNFRLHEYPPQLTQSLQVATSSSSPRGRVKDIYNSPSIEEDHFVTSSSRKRRHRVEDKEEVNNDLDEEHHEQKEDLDELIPSPLQFSNFKHQSRPSKRNYRQQRRRRRHRKTNKVDTHQPSDSSNSPLTTTSRSNTCDRVLRSSTQKPGCSDPSNKSLCSYEELEDDLDDQEDQEGSEYSSGTRPRHKKNSFRVRQSSSSDKSVRSKKEKRSTSLFRSSSHRKRSRSSEKLSRKKTTSVETHSEAKSLKVATGSCASTVRRESRSSTGSSRRGGNSRGSGSPSLIHMSSNHHHNLHQSDPGQHSGGPSSSNAGATSSGGGQNMGPPPVPPSSLSYHHHQQTSAGSSVQQHLLEHLGLQAAHQQDAHQQLAMPSSSSSSSSTAVGASACPSGLTSRFHHSGRGGSGSDSLDTFQNLMEEVDIGRLQSILESRGMPSSSIFSSPRMHQVAQQMAGHNLSNNVNQRISQLQQASGDFSVQFTIMQDINQSLLMGYEDNLGSIHVKQLVNCILEILRSSEMDELKSLGCNVLTHMMDILPRSADAVVPAIPLLLETMNNSALMDIFERVINALEHISRRHGRTVLQHGGITVVMRFFDFLTAAQQRTALSLVGNCFLSLSGDDFPLIAECLTGLTERIKQPDAKCVERVCTCFARLVAAYHNDEVLLKKIAANNLFPNLQHLLMASPPVISGIQEVVHMLATMCANCSDLAVVLMKQNIAETISFVLTGGSSTDKAAGVSQSIDNRRQEETFEIVNLVAELMPCLPTEGMFAINRVLSRPRQSVTWLWLSDSGDWTPYTTEACLTLEQARRLGEEEALVSVGSRRYIVDLASMYQQNMDTSVTRRVQRVVRGPSETSASDLSPTSAPLSSLQTTNAGGGSQLESKPDSRAEILREHSDRFCTGQTGSGVEAVDLIRVLLPLLLDVYAESSSANVKYKCLEAILRMISPTPGPVLEEVLSQRAISSSLATMMANGDSRVVVGSLQMAHLLLEKLPHIFLIYFKKEGVIYQLDHLVEGKHSLLSPTASQSGTPTSLLSPSLSSLPSPSSSLLMTSSSPPLPTVPPPPFVAASTSSPSSACTGGGGGGSNPNRLSEIFRRKHSRPSKARRASKDDHPYHMSESGSGPSVNSPGGEQPPLDARMILSSGGRSSSDAGASNMMTTSCTTMSKRQTILSHLNPARWARSSTGGGSSSLLTVSNAGGSGPSSTGPSTPRHFIPRTARGGRGSSVGSTPSPDGPSRDQQIRQWIMDQSRRLRQLFDDMSTTLPANSTSSGITTGHNSIAAANNSDSPGSMSLPASPAPVINDVLPHLQAISNQLSVPCKDTDALDTRPLRQLAQLLTTEGVDLSPFEIQHSGLVNSLLIFLSAEDHREARLRAFLRIFLRRSASVEDARRRLDSIHPPTSATPFSSLVARLVSCLHQQEQFQVRGSISEQAGHHHHPSSSSLHSGVLSGGHHHQSRHHHSSYTAALLGAGSSLLDAAGSSHTFLIGGSNPLVQLDLSSRSRRTGEIELSLVKHPEAGSEVPSLPTSVIKVDPLTTVEDVELLVLRRGLLRSSRAEPHSTDSSSGEDEEAIDESMASITLTGRSSLQAGRRGRLSLHHPNSGSDLLLARQSLRLQLVMHNQALPSEMPIYQAVKQFSSAVHTSTIDVNNEDMVNQAVWCNQHTVHYRLAPSGGSNPTSTSSGSSSSITGGSTCRGRRTRGDQQANTSTAGGGSGANSGGGGSAGNKRRRKDELWSDGQVPKHPPAVFPYLVDQLPVCEGCPAAKMTDPSATTLALQRLLNAINTYWYTLDSALDPFPVIPQSDFLSGKLSVKANRQMQDVFSVLAGNLPNWLIQLMTSCPFLFPFETRQNFFYAYNFDRDRTILRLQQEGNTADGEASSSDRLSVQMKRYKVTVTRGDKLLKQAEKTLSELGKTRAMLEIAFDGEVGFGLGPTLEFYTLISRELLQARLLLWHGEVGSEGFMVPPAPGLYPRPLARNARLAVVREIKGKYTFLGRLLARSLLDWRQLDLPLSPVFFKWLLGQQNTITAADLDLVDPNLARHLRELWSLVERRKAIERDPALSSAMAKEAAIRDLGVDDLYLNFVLPGYKIELMKNGLDIPVTADNLESYLRLVAHWMLVEGAQRQMMAMIEGFESVLTRRQLCLLFAPEELEWLFCGRGGGDLRAEAWDVRTLMEACCCDHGYTISSRSIRHLFEIMAEFSAEEKRLFLQFVTGSPRLPVGGFRALKPALKIVLKRETDNPDNHLPSVMTCQNYLKLPDYSSKELMREKLVLAIREGQLAFHLS